MSNILVWFDVPVVDLDRAVTFYSAILGIQVQKNECEGVTLAFFPHESGIGGCLFKADNEPSGGSGPLLYFGAEGRLDEAVAAVEPNGGQILQPKHSIAPHGFRAVIADSEGNRIALHSMEE